MKTVIRLFSFLFILIITQSISEAQRDIDQENVMDAMKKASKYMVETVSTHGGYVWYYKEDLSEHFGEVPARETQIWVQDPGTPAMGNLFLNMYETTGNETYLEYAKKAADALVYGQHPLGGWHYLIDFDPKGIEEWYENVASQFIVGWEEYRHYYGNCTYDDNVTQGATEYLLRLYMNTLDPEYLEPLKKALNFILISQYPNGGWPQRYPLRYEYVHDGLADYTSYYTLNDNVMNNNINLLLKAYEQLGDESYLEAAKRGGDFFMIAQGPLGQAAWTDQFDMDLQPAWGRTHEPASFQVRYTRSAIYELERLFLYTGDRRYLRPVPAAIDWIESVVIDTTEEGEPEFASWYDPETNYPIIRTYSNEFTEEGYLKYDYKIDSSVEYIDFSGKYELRKRFERIQAVDNEMERNELYTELYEQERRKDRTINDKEIRELIRSMNDDGIWIESFTVHDKNRTMEPNIEAVEEKGSYQYAVKEIEGISTRTFMNNMYKFMQFLQQENEK